MNRLRGVKLRRLARAAGQRIVPGSLILLYHRIAERDFDPWSLCVSPRHFAEHLDVLGGRTCPLTAISTTKNSEPRAAGRVVITFDDGYADVYQVAYPLLERHATPATVFITTGAVASGMPFWWDELDASLLHPRTLPGALELRIRGAAHRFVLDDEPPGKESAPGASRASRVHLHRSIHNLLGALSDEERRDQLAALRVWANVQTSPDPADRALWSDEVVRLAASPIVEIAAHGVTHSRLPALAPAAQEREIRDSRSYLESLIGRTVESFAYPHGLHDATTRDLLRASGFKRACTSAAGIARSFTDPLRLPRVWAPDCDGEAFARFLHRLGFAR